MAHQWFGDLVTMAWWDDLWLNEGFAGWMRLQGRRPLHPDWRVRLAAKPALERAMALDARASTHPIQQPVRRDSEAEAAFDEITYDKGAGFLRMLEAWLGESAFRAGVRDYLRRHRYSNTTGADLWRALGRASGRPVTALAADWTTQPGFPLVDVEARCEGGVRTVLLRQQRFRAPGDGDEAAAEATRWRIPLALDSVGAPPRAPTLLAGASESRRLDDGCRGALIVDRDDVGFFRVRYAPPLFDALVAAWPALPDAVRLKLLADTSALVRADQLALARYFELLPGLHGEPRLAVWEQWLRDLEGFDALAEDEPTRPALRRFARATLAPRFAALGWDERDDESAEDRQLRPRLALALSRYDDDTTIAEGRARFARYLAVPASTPPSLVEALIGIAGRHADAATYDALLSLAAQGVTSEERFRAYRALASAEDPALAARTVQLALDPGVPQIARHELLAIVARAGHRRLAWDFAREHADSLLADVKLYDSGRYFAQIVAGAATPASADELLAFAHEHLGGDALLEARRGADEIRTRAAMKARLLPQLDAALADR